MSADIKRFEVESDEKWREWIDKIPALRFPEDWEIKIIPPFSGAMVRFQVIKGENSISVYLDVYENLGFFGGPYWEIYPYENDIYRVAIDETDELLEKIREALEA